MQTTGPCLHECHRWDKAAVVQDPRSGYAHAPATVKAGMNVRGRGWDRAVSVTPELDVHHSGHPEATQVQVNTHNFLAGYLNWLFLRDAELVDPIPLEEPTRPLRLKYLLSDLYRHRHSPHTPTVSGLLFCFPTQTELVSPNKPDQCPSPSLLGRKQPEGRPISTEPGWNQHGAPGAVWSKERVGLHSCSNRCRG